MRASEPWWLTHHGWEALLFCIYTWYWMSQSSRPWCLVHVCDMMYSSVGHASEWLIMAEKPSSFVFALDTLWVTHLVHMCDVYERGTSHIWMPHIWARHKVTDLSKACHIYKRGASLIYVAFICDLVHMCDVPRSYMWHSCVWRASFMYVEFGIHMCDVPRSYMWHSYAWRASLI